MVIYSLFHTTGLHLYIHLVHLLNLRQGGCKRQQRDGDDNVVDNLGNTSTLTVCERQASMLGHLSCNSLICIVVVETGVPAWVPLCPFACPFTRH